MNLVDKAAQIAMKSHHGQVNAYSNEPYIWHPHRVYVAVRDWGRGQFCEAAAWLHDTMEDDEITTFDSLLDDGIDPDVVQAVDYMTKRAGFSNEEYYKRLKTNKIARIVKMADIQDNFSRNHLIEDEATRLRMAKKYSLGMDILK